MKRGIAESPVVAAVSGGPDSAFLLERLVRQGKRKIVVGHVNHGLRGRESDRDEMLVEEMAKKYRLDVKILKASHGGGRAGLEEKARDVRRGFLETLCRESGGILATGHTADDQVETILMRFLEGAGIAGLKGIPMDAAHGPIRPIIAFWKEDISKYLKENLIPFRIDRSNRDRRFERNWIRHVLLPLLQKRYGKGIKERIYTLGERFRELDDYLESEASRWIRRNVRRQDGAFAFRRQPFAVLPTALRIRILQKICFGFRKDPPNERLLSAMDRSIRSGKPSARVKAGDGWELANRYEETRFAPSGNAAPRKGGEVRMKDAGDVTPARARRIASRGNAEVFDSEGLRLPLTVRPLRHGDRILPFGQAREKKLKEILIDRKIPGGERWGRPVVCDSEGTILWVPGVIRSGHATVTGATRCAKILSYFA